MQLSYWEIKTWLSNVDYTVIGSGIVGLNCALQLRYRYAKAKILILEKGFLPQGASTKNAGFACFGSLSEIVEDLKNHSTEEVFDLVKMRFDGLLLLRQILSDKAIEYQQLGGYELFKNKEVYEDCQSKNGQINDLLRPLFNEDVFRWKKNSFNFENIIADISYNPFEGQIDTGRMMQALTQLVLSKDITILNSVVVEDFQSAVDTVHIQTNHFEFQTKKMFIATNGFASQLKIEEVKPARAQVLITKPIKNLHLQGTFHLDKGFYYFRNIDDRLLFGGGRNLDFKAEETTAMTTSDLIQNELDKLLKSTILHNTTYEVEHRWSGIMGVGPQKKPIVKRIDQNVFCGVRLGGMGIAIGSYIGKHLADLLD